MKPIAMRPSLVLSKLRAGETVYCFKHNLADARAVEIAARSGFDCLWLDLEHVPNGISAIEQGIWAAKSQGADTMVRVPRGSYSDLIRPLEMDASGIIVPHVMNLADAQYIARTTRFHPLGRRPVDGGNADGAYCAIDFVDYIRQANEQRFVAVQIEDPEVLPDLDAIAALPGIDMLFFGPGDFSHGIGAPGNHNDPRLLEARRRVAEAARANGKHAGTVATPETIGTLTEMGYRFLNIGADVIGLWQYCRSILDAVAQRPSEAKTRSYGET